MHIDKARKGELQRGISSHFIDESLLPTLEIEIVLADRRKSFKNRISLLYIENQQD
jgi:hypothetical protein